MKYSTISKSYTLKKCRYCGSQKLTKYISLGNQPPSNSFIQENQINKEKYYPLEVLLCRSCFLSQLSTVVSAKEIFDDYLYLSSSSLALKNHYAELTKYLEERFKLKSSDVVLDIGCNDGILLNGYNKNLTRIGVEPSKVSKIAKKAGFDVFEEFYSNNTAKRIFAKYGKVKIVTTTNVFAHVDDINEFVNGICTILDEGGVFIIEAPYIVDMIDKLYFDTIYHEHLSYLSITPLVRFFDNFGLEIFDVERIKLGASGPAIRIFVSYKNQYKIKSSVNKILVFEKKWGIKSITKYKSFKKNVEKVKTKLLNIINNIKKKNQTIAGYGAPAKGNTLLNYFGIDEKTLICIAETNKLKQGLVTPGTHIPIISEEDFLKKMPDYALLLSWNYLDFFMNKSMYIRKGGKFIVPLPKPYIIE